MSVPAAFFGPYDGQYASNVFVLGKYSALDYETSEPINALDGLLKKTKYGPDMEVGKGFFMSWAKNW
jgi:alpha-glucuronidase